MNCSANHNDAMQTKILIYEHVLFEKPGRMDARGGNGKDDATYGPVFAEDSKDEGFGGRKRQAELSEQSTYRCQSTSFPE